MLKAIHQGTFDGYGVIGRHHSLDESHHGWHTSSWPDAVGVPIHHYWVEDGNLREIALDDGDHIEPGGEADVKPAEKAAVLNAVKTWNEA